MADVGGREETDTPPDQEPRKDGRSGRRLLWVVIAVLAGLVVYAYAFEKTQVSLDKITDETRQESLFRVLRALGNPDLLTYESAETAIGIDYLVPCPSGGFQPEPAEETGPEISVNPPCADPRDEVTVSGTGLLPNTGVRIFFIPPNGIRLRLADNVRTDSSGSFEEVVRLPNRPDERTQTIEVISSQNIGSVFSSVFAPSEDIDPENGEMMMAFLDDDVIDSGELTQLPEDTVLRNPEGPLATALDDGQLTNTELRDADLLLRSPRWSQNAIDTLDKIIETVFLALLATTAGTAIAVPLSFIAARNLMREVRIPAIQVGLAISALPFGVALGSFASDTGQSLVDSLPGSALVLGAATLALGWVSLRLMRLAVPPPGVPSNRLTRIAAGVGAGIAVLLAGQTLARFAEVGGTWFAENAGGLAFMGRFVATNGDILATIFGMLAALAGAAILGFLGSRLGYVIGRRAPSGLYALPTILSTAMAGAILALGFGQVIEWLYQIVDTTTTVVMPLIIGAFLGALVGWLGVRKGQLAAGLSIYYVARTVFNTLRSIEPLVMAIVFVIWVGLGPFAGSLALGLHTIAALAKLYSEQVESISQGPVEAVRATGATRLQTVVYGVIPQIVAPYISFTMYRWDINVRLSTIIGFVGGGGIGFLLQQNIGLLDYRAAAAQMLAIAIVVATMDYISSRLRERFT